MLHEQVEKVGLAAIHVSSCSEIYFSVIYNCQAFQACSVEC